ncbi:hypothetical protein [Modestobacter excelsi]|uniref:hypothetical protein n=1 Tax=Modestobacter excelsi TaxID=2213161 RepID=UPI00110CFDFC|nr:hypothetical protein [Modestobacter excelsi]
MFNIMIRFGGAATAVSGVLVIAQSAWDIAVGGLPEGRAESSLHTAQMLLLVPGVVGLYLAQRQAMRTFGQIATLVAVVGSTLMFGSALTEVTLLPELSAAGSPLADDPGTTTVGVFLTSFTLWVAGLLLFGVASWRAGVLPRPAAALLVLGLLAALGLKDVVPGVLVFYAAGLIWLGVATAARTSAALADAPEPALARP